MPPHVQVADLVRRLQALELTTAQTPSGLIVDYAGVTCTVLVSDRGLSGYFQQLHRAGAVTDQEAWDLFDTHLFESLETCPPEGHLELRQRRGRWVIHRHGSETYRTNGPSGEGEWVARDSTV